MKGKNKNYNYILIPILSIGLFIYSIWCGLGYTFDSNVYEEIAVDFTENGLSGLNNTWLGNKPPLTSVIIALVGIEFMWLFNLLCFLVVVAVSFKLCIDQISDPIVKGLAVLVANLGLPVYMANNFLWSEPLFNVCVILLFYLFQSSSFNWKQWLLIILLSNIMILLRHAGVFVLIGLFASRFFFLADRSKWFTQFMMLGLCCLGSVVWFLTAPSSGSAWANEIGSVNLLDKVAHNFYMLSHAFTAWFLPFSVPYVWRLIIISLALFVFFILFKKYRLLGKIDFMWLSASAVYIAFLHGVYEMPIEDGERYFSPIFAIIFLVIFKVLDKYIITLARLKIKYAILIGVFIWSVYPTLRSVNNAHLWHTARCEGLVKSSPGIQPVGKE